MDKDKVNIFDTTLRDGEQSPGCSMTVEQKIEFGVALEELGVDIIEAGFPISSEEDYKGVSELSKVVTKSTIAGLARAIDKDIETAASAVRNANKPRIHTFMSTSKEHLEHQFKLSQKEALKKSVDAVKLAKSFVDDVEFSAMDATRSDKNFLYEVFSAAIDAGATTINVPDTVGYMLPKEYGDLINDIKENVVGAKEVIISTHCHNDLGVATANSLAGVESGARQVECTVNGVGERAGNAALEEIVMSIRTRKDYFNPVHTTINTKEIMRISKLFSEMTGMHVQRNKAIVGKNAFAHESGIHQDGLIKNKTTYEIMDPKDIGLHESDIVLGRHSGRAALKHRLVYLGYKADEEDVMRLFPVFKTAATKNKEVKNEELERMAKEHSLEKVVQK
jgi:2-isopropylmalate synthase